MYENIGFKGKLHAVLCDENGNVKKEQFIDNTITTWFDAYVANIASVGSAAKIGFMAVGSGTGILSTGSTLKNLVEIHALSGTGIAQGTGGDDNDFVCVGYWAAGVGTGSIREAGTFTYSGATMGSIITYNDAISVNKGASDTLGITWTVTCGAS